MPTSHSRAFARRLMQFDDRFREHRRRNLERYCAGAIRPLTTRRRHSWHYISWLSIPPLCCPHQFIEGKASWRYCHVKRRLGIYKHK